MIFSQTILTQCAQELASELRGLPTRGIQLKYSVEEGILPVADQKDHARILQFAYARFCMKKCFGPIFDDKEAFEANMSAIETLAAQLLGLTLAPAAAVADQLRPAP
jgi:hypothetical protein